MVGTFGPVGISVLVGSFVFGLGMQLGGGCGSGTLLHPSNTNEPTSTEMPTGPKVPTMTVPK
jgi:hypothetical protein